jgi:serine/threonine protein kinase
VADNLFDRVVVAIGTQYLVDGEIGRGGSAVVYRATDLKLGRQVAIKVLPPELAYNDSVRTRFIREAQTAAGLNHPNIVPIYSVDERDGLVYFVMGLVLGQSVGTKVAAEGPLPVERAERVLREVADALAYAHSRGVVHRDVKPDNILLDRDTGRALVSDFGIARASEGESRLTLTGVAVGTPAYMSPEQAMGERELDGRSDLYSLGVVGYYMLVGDPPFRASSAAAMLVKHVSEAPPRIRQKRADVPASLALVIDRALAKRPEDRWANASEFRDAIAGVVPASARNFYNEPQSLRAVDPSQLRAVDQAHSAPPDTAPSFTDFWRPVPPPPDVSRRGLRKWQREQDKDRRRALKDYDRHLIRHHAALVDSRVRSRHGNSYDDSPLVDRVLVFRGAAFRFIIGTPFFLIVNITTRGNFPWFFFPSAVLLFDALRRAGSIWSDGIGPLDAFRKGIRLQLLAADQPQAPRVEARVRSDSAYASSRASSPDAGAKRAERTRLPAPDRSLSAVPPDVMGGAHGATVRRALDDSSVVRDALARLGPLEREMLPDVSPTVDALTERVATLATTLHRLDMDVSGATLGSLDERIAKLTSDAGSPEAARQLSLLERRRSSLRDLLTRRQALVGQLESASLALQNLKLDLLKLRSAGVDSAINGSASATQEARSVSRDIGRIIDVADDLRNI